MQGLQGLRLSVETDQAARCSTMPDSFHAPQLSKVTFKGLPVQINTTPIPTLMGQTAFCNDSILDCNSWKMEKQIKLAKFVMHIGKVAAAKVSDTMAYAFDRYSDYKTGADSHLDAVSVATECKRSLECSSRVLNFLGLVTTSRNIQGTKEQWKAHLECIGKGTSNPLLPQHNEYNALSHKVIDTLGALAKQEQALKSFKQSPNATIASALEEACGKIDQEVETLFHNATENFEVLTGYTKDEFIAMMRHLKDRYCTPETLHLPIDQQVVQRMSRAEAHGMTSVQQMCDALNGDLNSVKLAVGSVSGSPVEEDIQPGLLDSLFAEPETLDEPQVSVPTYSRQESEYSNYGSLNSGSDSEDEWVARSPFKRQVSNTSDYDSEFSDSDS